MGKAVGFGELKNLPLKGRDLHSALDRVLKKTNRLLNYMNDVVVVVGGCWLLLVVVVAVVVAVVVVGCWYVGCCRLLLFRVYIHIKTYMYIYTSRERYYHVMCRHT